MMKILPITNTNCINKINFNGGVTKGTNKVIQNIAPEIKTTATALSGAVIVLAAINTKSKKKNDLADFQIKDLTDEEFEAKKSEIISRKDDFKAFKYLDEEQINKWKVQLFDYMMQNPEEYNDERYMKTVKNMTNQYSTGSDITDKNQAEVALRMLKMPWFLKAYDYASEYGIGNVARTATNGKVKNIKLKMLNKLDEYKDLKTFSGTQEVAIIQMLKDINTEYGLKVALKILENPDILDDQNHWHSGFSKDCFGEFSNKKQYADIKLDVIDRISSKPELFETKYFKNSLAGILNNITTQEVKEFAFKAFENPLLFENEKFADSFGSILYYYHYEQKDIQEGLMKILSAIEQRPELFKSEKFNDELERLVYIQKMITGATLCSHDELLRLTQINLFLIENGYYNA